MPLHYCRGTLFYILLRICVSASGPQGGGRDGPAINSHQRPLDFREFLMNTVVQFVPLTWLARGHRAPSYIILVSTGAYSVGSRRGNRWYKTRTSISFVWRIQFPRSLRRRQGSIRIPSGQIPALGPPAIRSSPTRNKYGERVGA